MRTLFDKLCLFFLASVLFFAAGMSSYDILIVLLVLSAASLSAFLDRPYIYTILFICACVVAIIFPFCCLFLPLFAYDVFSRVHRLAVLPAFLPLLFAYQDHLYMLLIQSLVLLVLGLLLSERNRTTDIIVAKYRHLSDKVSESQIEALLKNKELMEKQDYELYLATLKERNRIAHDLHDSIGHVLTSAILQTGAIMSVTKDTSTQQSLETLQQALSDGMHEVRHSIHDLHEQSIDLQQEVLKQLRQFGPAAVELKYNILSPPSQSIVYALLAILKEGLSNIAKHSDADHALLILHEHKSFYQFIFRDNGQACRQMNIDTVIGKGMGLHGLMNRVEALGGHIKFDCRRGFEIFITLPKEIAP